VALLAHERVEAVAVALPQRPEGLGGDDLAVEAIVGGASRARPHQHVDLAHVRVAVEQHHQHDLAEEAGDSGDQDLLAAEGLGEVEVFGTQEACGWRLAACGCWRVRLGHG
jgi:hypothetical protein